LDDEQELFLLMTTEKELWRDYTRSLLNHSKTFVAHEKSPPLHREPKPDTAGTAGPFYRKWSYTQSLGISLQDVTSDTGINNMDEYALQMARDQVKDLTKDLFTLSMTEDLPRVPRHATSIEGTLDLMNTCQAKILRKLDDFKTKRVREEDRHKASLTASMKNMKPLELIKLQGFSNFILWRKNQKHLNIHMDPYSRCEVLRNSLTDPQDIKACLYAETPQEILDYIDEKYANLKNLLPLLLGTIHQLPSNPTSTQIELSNIGTILSVHQQLKYIHATSRLDESEIEISLSKLTIQRQQVFEEQQLEKHDDDDRSSHSSDTDASTAMSFIASLDNVYEPEIIKLRRTRMLKYMKRTQEILRQLSVRQLAMGPTPMKPTTIHKVSREGREDSNPARSRHQVYCTTDVHEVILKSEQNKSECPLCQDYHTNKKGNYSTCLNLCETFQNQSMDDRLQTAQETNHCLRCLCKEHPSGKCFLQTNEQTPPLHWSLIKDHNTSTQLSENQGD
jgi:hypothetical protein